jgi:hypothetical protein
VFAHSLEQCYRCASYKGGAAYACIDTLSRAHSALLLPSRCRPQPVVMTDASLAALTARAALLAQGGLSKCNSSRGSSGLSFAAFQGWLDRATAGGRRPFDVIIDGANVGFLNQNFEGGGLMYSQVRVLAVSLPSHHAHPRTPGLTADRRGRPRLPACRAARAPRHR